MNPAVSANAPAKESERADVRITPSPSARRKPQPYEESREFFQIIVILLAGMWIEMSNTKKSHSLALCHPSREDVDRNAEVNKPGHAFKRRLVRARPCLPRSLKRWSKPAQNAGGDQFPCRRPNPGHKPKPEPYRALPGHHCRRSQSSGGPAVCTTGPGSGADRNHPWGVCLTCAALVPPKNLRAAFFVHSF